MSNTQEDSQQKFKELLQQIYTIGHEDDNIRTGEFIRYIQHKLLTVLEQTN
jgi:hypothetical protein